ncbi:hypothetical protein T08_7704 [Trichinella sp. T8]|nr:hypothetical protein T08_7704 [Trichinella sp. T8]
MREINLHKITRLRTNPLSVRLYVLSPNRRNLPQWRKQSPLSITLSSIRFQRLCQKLHCDMQPVAFSLLAMLTNSSIHRNKKVKRALFNDSTDGRVNFSSNPSVYNVERMFSSSAHRLTDIFKID